MQERMIDPFSYLCIDELNWCRRNQEVIVNKANVLKISYIL